MHQEQKTPHLEEVSWEAVREGVRQVNKEFADIIDEVDPSKAFTFVKARYPFGSNILQQGVLQLPTSARETAALTDTQIPQGIQAKLTYSAVPIGVVLNKSVEVFFEAADRVMPSKLFEQGALLGLWEFFDPPSPQFAQDVWNLSAGARTTFLLPKVSDNTAHARLRRDYNVMGYPPRSLLEHKNIFSKINEHTEDDSTWMCEILFLTNQWLEGVDNELVRLKLEKYCLLEAWRQSYNCRIQMSYDVAWEEFSKLIARRHLKLQPYTINTIKHLLAIADGVFPGFQPSNGCEQAAPVASIQKAYIDSYGLKSYAPIVMQPYHLDGPGAYVYYSLALPTLVDFASMRNAPSNMAWLREIRMLMDVLQRVLEDKPINFEYFHSDKDHFGEIRSTIEMLEEDKKLMAYPQEYGVRTFPENSPFFKGCIRISLQ